MKRVRHALGCALAMCAGVYACSSSDGGDNGPPDPGPGPGPGMTEQIPEEAAMVARGSFDAPTDAVSSHDGATLYFAAHQTVEEQSQAGVFSVSAAGGDVTTLHLGSPLGNPTGLVLSCDDETLFIADRQTLAADDPDDSEDDPTDERGTVFTLRTRQGSPVALSTAGILIPSGLALSVDCSTLYVTGINDAGQPALFSVPVEGGNVTTILAGDPLVSPTGVHVDKDGVAWVLDHLARGDQGPGVLFAVPPDGTSQVVASGLRMGTPGGVSLSSTGGMAYVPTVDDDGNGQLTGISLATQEITQIPTPNVADPAGFRTARNAAVFALVDAQGGAIFIAR